MNVQKIQMAGFSLMEMLIVISIMMLLLGGGVSGYSRFIQQKKWEKDIEAVLTIIESGVQKSALRDLSSQACASFTGYQIDIDSTANTVRLSLSCPTKIEVASYTLQSSRFSSSTTSTMQIQYPYGVLSSPATIMFKNSYGSECQPVNISTQGVITQLKRISC